MSRRTKRKANKNLMAVLIISGALHVVAFLVLGSIVIFTAIPQSKPEFEEPEIPQPINLKEVDMKQDMSKMVRTGGSSGRTASVQRDLITVQNPVSALPALSMSVSPVSAMGAPGFSTSTASGIGSGIGSGTGDGLGGLGKSGGIGMGKYSVSFLGVQSGGERVAILVDCSDYMLEDGKGGMWAFRIVKDECVKLVQNLLPGVLFNVYLFSNNNVFLFKEHMVASTPATVNELREWIAPVNEDATKRGARVNNFTPEREYFNQRHTLYWGAKKNEKHSNAPTVANYARALHAAMADHAEAIFMIIATFPPIPEVLEDMDARSVQAAWARQNRADQEYERKMNRWKGSRDEEKWLEWEKKRDEAHAPVWQKAKDIWDAENARRKAAGLPPRIVVGNHLLTVMRENNLKFPDVPRPQNVEPRPIRQHVLIDNYSVDKMIERFSKEIIPDIYRFHPKKVRPSVNVILFGSDQKAEDSWTKFVGDVNRGTRGQFRKITSLAEMKAASEESERNRQK
jgi:hypothetical protein